MTMTSLDLAVHGEVRALVRGQTGALRRAVACFPMLRSDLPARALRPFYFARGSPTARRRVGWARKRGARGGGAGRGVLGCSWLAFFWGWHGGRCARVFGSLARA